MTVKTTCSPACGAAAAIPLATPPCFSCPPATTTFGVSTAEEPKTEEPAPVLS